MLNKFNFCQYRVPTKWTFCTILEISRIIKIIICPTQPYNHQQLKQVSVFRSVILRRQQNKNSAFGCVVNGMDWYWAVLLHYSLKACIFHNPDELINKCCSIIQIDKLIWFRPLNQFIITNKLFTVDLQITVVRNSKHPLQNKETQVAYLRTK